MRNLAAIVTRLGASVALFSVIAAQAVGAVNIVDSNSSAPGDDFTNSGTTTTGQAVGSSGWYYNNVRNNGHVGINTDYPRAGNGSASFSLTQGGATSSKSDLEFLPSATANGNGNWSPTAALGLLSDLTSLSYDWYRDSTSAANVWLAPTLRLQIYNPNTGGNGYLVFEYEVNQAVHGAAAPTNTWVSEDVFANNDVLWATGNTIPGNLNATNHYYDAPTLSGWQSQLTGYYVVGVSVGAGSGWDTFKGAVDNVTFGFNGASTTYNFDVAAAVPEASTLAIWGVLGAATVGIRFRRRV